MSVIERAVQVGFRHRVFFTRRVFDPANPLLKDVLAGGANRDPHNALVVLDESLAQAQMDLERTIGNYFAAFAESLRLVCPPLVIEGGERTKNSYFHVSEIHSHIDRYHIDRHGAALREFNPAAMRRLIFRCAELHVDHIASSGDPFEFGSARPLDFGHWSAHKLEQLSDYSLRHGEAVAVGIALDTIYSRKIGCLGAAPANRVLGVLEKLGFELFANELLNVDSEGHLMILKGLEEFRE